MSKISWIHLSDWHQRGSSFDRDVVRDALLQDIKGRSSISDELATLDFVVFSGDLAFSGVREEYETADREFVKRVLQACGLDYDRFLIVPGNHDVRRDLAKKVNIRLADFGATDSLAIDFADPHKRNIYLASLGPYIEYVSTVKPTVEAKNRAYGLGRVLRTSAGAEVGFLCLNSTWLSSHNLDSAGEVEDYGQPMVGEAQVEEAIKGLGSCDLIVGIMHHPFSWLVLKEKIDDRKKVRDRLMEVCDLILHGHEHEPATFLHQGTYGKCITVPAGATFTKRDAIPQSNANGYNYCRVDLDEKRCKIHFRRFDGDRKWIADLQTADPAEIELEIPYLGEKPHHKPSARPSKPPMESVSRTPEEAQFVGSNNPDSVLRISGLVLEKNAGGIQASVFLQGFGNGIRRLVNNRHIFAHAVSPSVPYTNVFSLSRGPSDFSDAKRAPAWKLWLASNNAANGTSWRYEDKETTKQGWHHFLVRWDHRKPVLEVLLDGSVIIAQDDYLRFWPKRIMADISVGCWPTRWSEHFIDTWVANVCELPNPFDSASVDREVGRCRGLRDPAGVR